MCLCSYVVIPAFCIPIKLKSSCGCNILYSGVIVSHIKKYLRDFRLPLQYSWGILFLWDVTLRRLVVSYQCFRTMYQPHLEGSSSPRRNSFWTA
jgi:hypothetical protein